MSEEQQSNTDKLTNIDADFRVNESGAATYTIPIMLADGTAGVVPDVSLYYSSQSDNGIAGWGWSVNGLSAISRCRQTPFQDKNSTAISWSSDDRFCLNGSRLLVVGGAYGAPNSTYRTEVDSHVLVTAKGGIAGHPDYFELKAKDGSTTLYGSIGELGNADQAAFVNGKKQAERVLNWNISEFQDSVGNKIVYSYMDDETGYLIETIEYAFGDSGSAGAEVVFKYEDRLDQSVNYVSGYKFKNTQRLKYVSSNNSVDGAEYEIRRYNLSYHGDADYPSDELSRLKSISLCAMGICYDEVLTQFSWGEGNLNLEATPNSTVSLPENSSLLDYKFPDINGDGVNDIVWVTVHQSQNQGNGYYRLSYRVSGENSTPYIVDSIDTKFDSKLRIISLDYNADGRQDLIFNGTLYTSEPQEGGEWRLKAFKALDLGYKPTLMDLNNDGLVDLVRPYSDEEGAGFQVQYLQQKPWGLTSDPDHYYFGPKSYIPVLGESIKITYANIDISSYVLGDFNGDGLTDLAKNGLVQTDENCVVWEGATNGGANCTGSFTHYIYVYLRDSDGFTLQEKLLIGDMKDVLISGSRSDDSEGGLVLEDVLKVKLGPAIDINGDGLSDLSFHHNSDGAINGWGFRLSLGVGFGEPQTLVDFGSKRSDEGPSWGDYNQDGLIDFIWTDHQSEALKYSSWDAKTERILDKGVITKLVSTGQRQNYSLSDHNGDGLLDLIHFDLDEEKINAHFALTKPSERSDLIHNVVNTVGYTTNINYALLTHSDHYTSVQGLTSDTDNNGERCESTSVHTSDFSPPILIDYCYSGVVFTQDPKEFYTLINEPFSDLPEDTQTLNPEKVAPILEVAGPAPIVASVFSDAPTVEDPEAKVGIAYYYHQMRAQAGGAGALGFKALTTVDLQTLVKSTTTYRQDWPFTGQPMSSVTRSSDGHILKKSTNIQEVLNLSDNAAETLLTQGSAALGPIQIYIPKTVDTSYDLLKNGSEAGAILSAVVTETIPDSQGNVVDSVVSTYEGEEDGVLFSRVTTKNQYPQDSNELFLGRLARSDVTTHRPGVNTDIAADSVTRSANFSYYGMGASSDECSGGAYLDGLLCGETILVDEQPQTTTLHFYDEYGNKTYTATKDENSGEERLSGLSRYDASGRYISETYGTFNGILTDTGIAESDYLDKAHSIGASVRLLSKVDSRNAYGAATQNTSFVDDGVGVVSFVGYTLFGIEYFTATSAGAYSTKVSSLGVAGCSSGAAYSTTQNTAGGGQARACFDKMGRTLRSLKQSFYGDGASDKGWVAVDTQYDQQGRIHRVSEPYFAANDPVYWTETTAFDLMDRPLSVMHPFFETDSEGEETGQRASSSVSYSGLTTVATNPKGQVKTEVSNLAGEVVLVTNNQQKNAFYDYDVYGHLVQMVDPADNKTRISFNSLGQKEWMDDPDKGRWDYTYNNFGDLLCQQDAKKQLIINQYDFNGRKVARSDHSSGTCENPDGAVNTANWEYDVGLNGVGQLSSQSSGEGHGLDYYYDHFGRAVETITHTPGDAYVSSSSHNTKVTYDQYGRVFQRFDAAREDNNFNRGATQSIYDKRGYLWKVVDANRVNGDFATEYYRVEETDARGNVTRSVVADGVTETIAHHNAKSGLVEKILTQTTLLKKHQDLNMRWDHIGNLAKRVDNGHKMLGGQRDLSERFGYDSVNQLTSYSVTGDVSHETTVKYTEDGIGNILSKSDVGTYEYLNGRPHAVSKAGSNDYHYDANGNVESDDERTFVYSEFDKVTKITKGNQVTEFFYDSSRNRYKRRNTQGSDITTTLYLGSVEKIYYNDKKVEWKRNLGFAQITMSFDGDKLESTETHYLHKDHLGSITAISDSKGDFVQHMAFDPWGQRRKTQDWTEMDFNTVSSSFNTLNKPITKRGFTGHEMVDEVGIIHMNGRIYDAKLARFLQADPIIQAPTMIGSLNRYSYTMNNPLNAIDPSGFSWWTSFRDSVLKPFAGLIVGAFLAAVNPAFFVQQLWGAISLGAISGGVGAAVNGGNILKSALIGGVSGAAFFGVGKLFSSGSLSGMKGAGRFAAHTSIHGATGGLMSVLQGGKFGHGFVTSGVAKGFSLGALKLKAGNVGQFLTASIAGGTASRLTGGKFANGAQTAALAFLVNQLGSELGKATAGKVGKRGVSLRHPGKKVRNPASSDFGTVKKVKLIYGPLSKSESEEMTSDAAQSTSNRNLVVATAISGMATILTRGGYKVLGVGEVALNYYMANDDVWSYSRYYSEGDFKYTLHVEQELSGHNWTYDIEGNGSELYRVKLIQYDFQDK